MNSLANFFKEPSEALGSAMVRAMSSSGVSLSLESLKSFDAHWTKASVEDDLQRWQAFLHEHGISWSIDADTRKFVDSLIATGSPHVGEGIELRLAKLAGDVLARNSDPRVVCKRASTRTWYVLSPEERQAFEQQGHRFEHGLHGPLLKLASVPVALGSYFASEYVFVRAGLDPNLAWIVALVVYALTVRVVRGRWPLQR